MDEQTDEAQPQDDAMTVLFLRLGYDISNNDEVQRLASNLRYADESRDKNENKNSNKFAWMVTAIISLAGSGMTVIAQILFDKIFGVIPK